MMENARHKIRKDDQVMVVTGKEKGKTGRVVRVEPSLSSVIVEKLNVVKRHQRPTQKAPQGGIVEKEALIHISKVMLLCRTCKGPVRVGKKILDSGKKVRYCKSCNEVF